MDETRELSARPFVFHGQTGTYFKIWIVNVALSVVTLGVYTAWAKVRTKRYFNGSLDLDGHGFDYHAKPATILRGRVVALAVLIAYQVAVTFAPIVGGLLALAAFFAVPWLINAATRFNARMSSHRNVRFGFVGSYGGALWAYALFPLLAALTLGALWPLAARARDRYLAQNYRYGDKAFAAGLAGKTYYGIYLKGVLWFLAGLVAIIVITLLYGAIEGIFSAARGLQDDAPIARIEAFAASMTPVLLVLTGFVVLNVVAAQQLNYVYDNLALDGRHRFASNLSPWRMAWIKVSNLIAIVLSLGLALPWARIRLAKYRAACLTFLAADGLDAIARGAVPRGGVVGEEMADMWDLEVAI